MSARSPAEGVAQALEPLQRVLSCISTTVLVRTPTPRTGGLVEVALPGDGSIVLPRRAERLRLTLRCVLRVEQARGGRLPWQVDCAGYAARLMLPDDEELIAWHWHPTGRSTVTRPHLHLPGNVLPRQLRNTHIPTERVPLPAIVHYAIAELGVGPRRADWRAVLETSLDVD